MTANRTLVLNASGEPHSVISHEDAICLMLDEKASMVLGSGKTFHSPSMQLEAPSVVQLHRYVRLPDIRRKVLLTRRNVVARDNFECAYCDDEATTMDHIVPKYLGGKHIWKNVTASCRPCNQRKGKKTLEELGWELTRKPYEPSGVGIYIRSLRVPSEWEPYLV